MAENDTGPFDPLSEGRAGDAETHVTLVQRGKVLLQLREEHRRKESYSVHTRRISHAMLGMQVRKPPSQRRFVAGGEAGGGGSGMAIVGEGIAGATSDNSASSSNSSNSIDSLSASSSASSTSSLSVSGTDPKSLVRSAVFALWANVRIAKGFRQWKEMARGPVDLSRLGEDVDLNGEARKTLIAAETARQVGVGFHEPSGGNDEEETRSRAISGGGGSMGIRLSRSELDLLTVWARQLHSKTFRSVDDASICEAMRFLRFKTYQDGDSLFYEGEAGDTFYVVFQGTVAVFVGMQAPVKASLLANASSSSSSSSARSGSVISSNSTTTTAPSTRPRVDWTQLGKRVFTYRTGDSFGETAMFSNDATRTASAIAVGPCEVCELHKDVYRRTLRKYHEEFFEQAQKLNFLQRVALFRELPRPKLTAMAELLEKKTLCYGDTFVSEKNSGPPLRECFFVLSGVVKLTQTIDVPGCASTSMNPVEAAAAADSSGSAGCGSTMSIIKKKHVAQMKIELQTVLANEIVALEALLDPYGTGAISGTKYNATAASATVEVYVLHERDARAFIGSSSSAISQTMKRICEKEAAYRDARRTQTHHALLASRYDGGSSSSDMTSPRSPLRRPIGWHETVIPNNNRDSLDLVAASPESPRHGNHDSLTVSALNPEAIASPSVPGLQVVRPPMISEGTAPYLPNLRAMHLFPSGSGSASPTTTPRDQPPPASTSSSAVSDMSVVSSPKMLSNCVRKFLFENSETLAPDYVDRLRLQFPVAPAPPLHPTSHSGGSKTHRDGQRILDAQLAKMYDSKMHWDPKKRDFVVGSSSSSTAPAAAVTPSMARRPSSRERRGGQQQQQQNAQSTLPTTTDPLAPRERKNTFQKELRATQQVARKLVASHFQRVAQKPQNASPSSTSTSQSSSGAFLHFFADT